MADAEQLAAFLVKRFPPMRWLFAYGSSVFPQTLSSSGSADAGDEKKKAAASSATNNNNSARDNTTALKMLDLIAVVDDPFNWHRLNRLSNPSDYSWLASRYPNQTHALSELGAGVSFNNTLIPTITNATTIDNTYVAYLDEKTRGSGASGEERRPLKYGVISTSRLIHDCLHWDSLYIAGRLHKPILSLHPTIGVNAYPANDKLADAVKANRKRAVQEALSRLHRNNPTNRLTTPFTLDTLLTKIVSLSYAGDIRIGLAEDPLKVAKIVDGARQYLREMYAGIVEELVSDGLLSKFSSKASGQNMYVHCEDDVDDNARCEHARLLKERVRWASTIESIKAIWTVGPKASLFYLLAKIGKRFGGFASSLK